MHKPSVHFCHLCGQTLTPGQANAFIHVKGSAPGTGLQVCAACLRNKPRCVACGNPMLETQSDIGLCSACLHAGVSCRACGRKIRGGYIILNETDGPYCDACAKYGSRCEVCGLPVSTSTPPYSNGGPICLPCHQTGVTSPADAADLFEQVVKLLEQKLSMRLNIRPTLALVDQPRLRELASQIDPNAAHGIQKPFGLFMRRGYRRAMYLQEGLPRILMIQVIAHEYAHAWQAENYPLLNDLMLSEGFAEWVAHTMLRELDAAKKARQMEARQDHYGEGLRYFMALESVGGYAAILTRLAETS